MLTSVYIIDDDPIDCFITQKVLGNSFNETTIRCFHNARTALDKIRELIIEDPLSLPDFIFLDINMPLMNGFAFVDQFTLLHASLSKKPVILMLSSSLDSMDISKALQSQMVATYLSKPLTREILEITLQTFYGPLYKQYMRVDV